MSNEQDSDVVAASRTARLRGPAIIMAIALAGSFIGPTDVVSSLLIGLIPATMTYLASGTNK